MRRDRGGTGCRQYGSVSSLWGAAKHCLLIQVEAAEPPKWTKWGNGVKTYKPLKGECPACQTQLLTPKPKRYQINECYEHCPGCGAFLHTIATHWRVRFNLVVPRTHNTNWIIHVIAVCSLCPPHVTGFFMSESALATACSPIWKKEYNRWNLNTSIDWRGAMFSVIAVKTSIWWPVWPLPLRSVWSSLSFSL